MLLTPSRIAAHADAEPNEHKLVPSRTNMSGRKETEFRSPTDEEIRLLRFALNGQPGEFRVYSEQLEGLRVRYSCECGCPSLTLAVADSAPTGIHQYEVLSPGIVTYDDETGPCDVILFIKDGILSELEIAPMVDTPRPDAHIVRLQDWESYGKAADKRDA